MLFREDLSDLETLYPDVKPEAGTLGYVSDQFERVSEAYGDYSYICPVQDTASVLSSTSAPVYKARWNTPNWAATYLGVPHASDSSYFNGQANTQYPVIADMYSAYWASFIVSGDPNTYALPGSATWEQYEGTGSRQLVVNPPTMGGAMMEDEGTAIRMEQCAWWRDPERAARLNK